MAGASADPKPALAALTRAATAATLNGMARYSIPSNDALGVSIADIQKIAKQFGKRHDLALALWDTGVYEARLLAAYVDEPDKVTAAQMERWCKDFDSWAVCDTVCFVLFDRSPHAWGKVRKWGARKNEFEKRAAFALLACLALHRKDAAPEDLHDGLALIESAAGDERNFVKKAVSWALRAIGGRAAMNAAACALAERLADSPDAPLRWIGKDALRAFAKSKRAMQPEKATGKTAAKKPPAS